MKRINLPRKVYLPLAIQELGLRDIGDSNAIRDVLQLIGEYNSTIHFDSSIVAATSTDEPEAVSGPDNEYQGSIIGGNPETLPIKPKILIDEHAVGLPHTPLIQITSFLFDNSTYYPCDDTGYWLEPAHIHASELYFDKVEFENFESRVRSVKSPTQAKREEIFTVWICTKADVRYEGKPSLQKAYEKIGRPTQARVWKALENIAPYLFSSGDQQFFRNLMLITFAAGTGVKRGGEKNSD
jgi:hypothetical protein